MACPKPNVSAQNPFGGRNVFTPSNLFGRGRRGNVMVGRAGGNVRTTNPGRSRVTARNNPAPAKKSGGCSCGCGGTCGCG